MPWRRRRVRHCASFERDADCETRPGRFYSPRPVLLFIGWAAIYRFEFLHRESHFFFRHQLAWSVLAVGAALFVGFGPRLPIRAGSYQFFAVSLALLAVVFLFPPINGAHRWIRLGPIGFQPSEPAKLAVVLAVARRLAESEVLGLKAILAVGMLTGTRHAPGGGRAGPGNGPCSPPRCCW